MADALLIGDICKDVYHIGEVKRLNPEAPVPIFTKDEVRIGDGMALNVRNNLLNLYINSKPYFSLESTKTRFIDRKSGYHLLRFDEDVQSPPLQFKDMAKHYVDVVVISDYNKGFITLELIEDIIKNYDCPIFIDTKNPNIFSIKLSDQTFVKINEEEHENAVGSHKNEIITMGDKGAMYRNRIFPTSKVDVNDVCGAGDTFLAALTYMYLRSKNIEDAIRFANRAAAITVTKLGTYAPTYMEIGIC